ncbi:MAG: 2-phosphosulfolactate phosphatase [Bacteroidota bacterium]|nr:2-phosphosulfolactate phosphatase [Bacteroidota bacterium]
MTTKRSLEVCYSPISYPLFKNNDAIVVVIDIFRATSAICTALYHGATSIIPVATVGQALDYKLKGYMAAAERHGEVVPGFEFGNSPFSYMGEGVKGKTIVLTTTNGTQAVEVSKEAYKVVIGSFLNLSVLSQWVQKQDRDVVLLCAGWKNKFNLEDTLFAGAMAQKLIHSGNYNNSCDTTQAAIHLYETGKSDLYKFLENSSHRKRLEKLNLERDIKYCLELDLTPVIPVLDGIAILKL